MCCRIKWLCTTKHGLHSFGEGRSRVLEDRSRSLSVRLWLSEVFSRILKAYATKLFARLPKGGSATVAAVTGMDGLIKVKFLSFWLFQLIGEGNHTLLKDLAGNHTLLKDFNASLNTSAPGVLVREFYVNVVLGQRLNITFTPNRSYPKGYAFINGIDVVSMPTFLYYTNPDDQNAMMLDGGTHLFPVNNDCALEAVYRINVGGRQIPPENDPGMFGTGNQIICTWR